MLKNIQLLRSFSKVINKETALNKIKSGDLIAIGGFGMCGVPNTAMKYLQGKKEINNLTIVSNNAGIETYGIGLLLANYQVKRMVSSYVGENKNFESQYFNGELEVEITPQGTLAEKLRSGGAGIPGYYTQTGVGTILEDGGFPIKFNKNSKEPEILSEPKESKMFNNKKYILEESIVSDISIVKAKKADKNGNLIFNKSARNFNEDAVKAGKYTIVEAEEIVEVGELDPESIHVPGIYVDAIYKTEELEKPIERVANKENKSLSISGHRGVIAKRASQLINNGDIINVGIGIPTFVPTFIDHSLEYTIHCENGVLGADGYPEKGFEDADLIDPGKETISIGKGASFFSSSNSFAMIRGGHVDITMLGGMEVSENGDLANWIIPNKLMKGMGGAMDLVAGSKKVVVLMEHTNKKGQSKILKKCDLPLTGKNVVDLIITELAVFEFENNKMILREIHESTTLEEVKSKTLAEFKVCENLKTFN